MEWLDRLVASLLAPLAMWVLASGLDDLFLDAGSIYFRVVDWRRRGRTQTGHDEPPAPAREKKIALLIPAWREDAVIERMLERNLAAIEYSNYEVFVGVYPNDLRTQTRVLACEKRHAIVHRVVCPHDGPTSKADCLNWICRGVMLREEQGESRFEVLLHHDAEDLIHAGSLGWVNRYCERYDMVQVPVLPLETPWWEFTHGSYCDEFAENQLEKLHLRQRLGGFLPSCGVGTAYRREIADRLAWNNGGRLFEPSCLTEDYRVGLELHQMGCSQILLDAGRLGGKAGWAATREYFPREFRGAVRQRARWVAGIALQCWQEFGWRAGKGQWYWLWRDRKGLLGNPLTILANLIFAYGFAQWVWAQAQGEPWPLAQVVTESAVLWWILVINAALFGVRQVWRAACVWRVYGRRNAAASLIRSLWGNVINFTATVRAVGLFASAQMRGRPVPWLKTDHSYPSIPILAAPQRRLGDILIEMRLLPLERIEQALRWVRPGERLGECLVRQGALTEADVYRALAAQKPEGRR